MCSWYQLVVNSTVLNVENSMLTTYLQCEGDSRTYKLEQSWGFWSDITFINIMSKIAIVQDTSQLIECQQVSIYDIKPISYDQQKSSYHVMITMQTWFNVVFKFTLALVCLSNCFFLCNGIRWPLFSYLHQEFTFLINYLLCIGHNSQDTEHMIQITCYLII